MRGGGHVDVHVGLTTRRLSGIADAEAEGQEGTLFLLQGKRKMVSVGGRCHEFTVMVLETKTTLG